MNSAKDNELFVNKYFLPPAAIPREPLVWWPREVIGVPCPFLRSALFSVSSKNERSFIRQSIFANHGITIEYTGSQLSQADLDVWAAVLKDSRFRDHDDINAGVMFLPYIEILSIRKFLRKMGRKEGGADTKRFIESINRLQSAELKVEYGKYSFSGNLIRNVSREHETYWIALDPSLANLFGRSGWTGVEVEQRKKLQKLPLAQWLHGFYSSHKNSQHFYSVKKIRMLCGSRTTDLYGFKRDVKKALEKVACATGWECRVRDDDCIEVIKPAREEVLIESGLYVR